MKVFIIIAVLVSYARGGITANSIPRFATGFIINGQEAEPYSHRSLVSLQKRRYDGTLGHFCAGSILNEILVLTAAHCVYPSQQNIEVVAGLHSLSDTENGVQRHQVNGTHVHEKYGGGVGPYDIALLRIVGFFKFNDRVGAASLPYDGEMHSGVARISGWGKTNPYNNDLPDVVMTALTNIITPNECKSRLPGSPVDDTNICTYTKGENTSACNGDSGGPVEAKDQQGNQTLIGLVSWGMVPCGRKPSVHTRVSEYIEWINNITQHSNL